MMFVTSKCGLFACLLLGLSTADDDVGVVQVSVAQKQEGPVTYSLLGNGYCTDQRDKKNGYTLQSCADRCAANPPCKGFAFNTFKGNNQCLLSDSGCTSRKTNNKPWKGYSVQAVTLTHKLYKSNSAIAVGTRQAKQLPGGTREQCVENAYKDADCQVHKPMLIRHGKSNKCCPTECYCSVVAITSQSQIGYSPNYDTFEWSALSHNLYKSNSAIAVGTGQAKQLPGGTREQCVENAYKDADCQVHKPMLIRHGKSNKCCPTECYCSVVAITSQSQIGYSPNYDTFEWSVD